LGSRVRKVRVARLCAPAVRQQIVSRVGFREILSRQAVASAFDRALDGLADDFERTRSRCWSSWTKRYAR